MDFATWLCGIFADLIWSTKKEAKQRRRETEERKRLESEIDNLKAELWELKTGVGKDPRMGL